MPTRRDTGGVAERPSLHMLMRRSWERPRVSDWEQVVSRLPLFANLKKRQIRRIAALAKVVEFEPHEPIVREGAASDGFYLILAGRAKTLGKSGRSFGPGQFFGEMAIIDGQPRSATVVATNDVQAMKLPHREFRRILAQDPRISLAIMQALAERIRRIEHDPLQ